MKFQSANSVDSTGEILDIGLMAVASPDFAEAMILALLAAGEGFNAADEPGDGITTQVAA